jgi:hypothetical protein
MSTSPSIASNLKEKLTATAIKMPSVPEEYSELYTMAFKKTANLPKTEVIFWHGSDKVAATEAGRKYCERHGLRFIWVDRFCIDINAAPRREVDAE